ncbi:MAG: ATP-dependent helicase UvrD1 [Planctomycetota bacterium]|jgi:DNA helicase-2/ATP-dependent DNA helicase PcrA
MGIILDGLNDRQRDAVEHGSEPLLIIAGAGTGKTKTLVHRVARLIDSGVDPSRILLMTFTRRAAGEMLRRVGQLLQSLDGRSLSQRIWGGTFHATATKLLRTHGDLIGLRPDFTIHDRGDSEDFLDVVRTELGFARTDRRFPKKGTCMAIYSHAVNSQSPLEETLLRHFPWCIDDVDDLKKLFKAYVDRKEDAAILDYDDLLLFFHGLLDDPQAGVRIRSRFECVLVDEYQDTNRLQAETLRLLKPEGVGLTVVGDDAQSIYSFRAASIRNILDFPAQFPGTKVVKLEQNYRSTAPLLAATNAVIAPSSQRFEKRLWSTRAEGAMPQLVQCMDETEQAEFLVRQVLEHREQGVGLKRQAILFRASHHSVLLEAELARARIPFVKYGGLKFVEAAHVKDMLAILRLAENPRDLVSGTRALMLLPGIGPKRARQLMDQLAEHGGQFSAWDAVRAPDECQEVWREMTRLLRRLARDAQRGGGAGASEPSGAGQTGAGGTSGPADASQAAGDGLAAQVDAVRRFYQPLLEQRYDNTAARIRDLEQMEQVASRFQDRPTFLAEIALDPPNSTQDLAADPTLDDDQLVLSTIHSAKGLEWDAVYVIHAADGNIPVDLATRSTDEIEEERRLFYVALTRAKNWLYVCHPLRYYQASRGTRLDRHSFSQLTRFLPPDIVASFQRRTAVAPAVPAPNTPTPDEKRQEVRQRSRAMWN